MGTISNTIARQTSFTDQRGDKPPPRGLSFGDSAAAAAVASLLFDRILKSGHCARLNNLHKLYLHERGGGGGGGRHVYLVEISILYSNGERTHQTHARDLAPSPT